MSDVLAISLPQLDRLENMLKLALSGQQDQAWFTLEQAYQRKFGKTGGPSLQSIKNTRALQPRGGEPDAWQSGRRVWTFSSVREWLDINDGNLEEYLGRLKYVLEVPDRIQSANKKRGKRV